MSDRDDSGGSTVCMAHMLVDGHVIDPQTRADVARFRRAERARLMALRRAMSAAELRAASDRIAGSLTNVADAVPGAVIAVYWPIRGEPDLRNWMAERHADGVRVALPVVVEKNRPLVFRLWQPGCRMQRGLWDIPCPVDGAEVVPQIVVAPVVGIDRAGYRLGNGGGYYDRTLAQIGDACRAIGVGAASARIDTIFPMPWDIAMDDVVLDDPTSAQGG